MPEIKLKMKKTSDSSSSKDKGISENEIPSNDEKENTSPSEKKPKIKLNLTALKGDSEIKKSDKTDKNLVSKQKTVLNNDKEVNEDITSQKSSDSLKDDSTQRQKIQLSSIRTQKNNKETSSTNEEKTQKKNLPEEEKKEVNNSQKSSSLKTPSTQKDEKNTKEESSPQNIEEEREKLFHNYESHFEKKSHSLLEKIKNIRNTPQTRIGLIVFLISITIIIIGGLMIFSPDKHSFSIYKANILQIYNEKMTSQSKNTTNNSQTTDVVIDVQIPSSQPIIEQEAPSTTEKKDTPENILENEVEENPKNQKQKLEDFLKKNYQK